MNKDNSFKINNYYFKIINNYFYLRVILIKGPLSVLERTSSCSPTALQQPIAPVNAKDGLNAEFKFKHFKV